jgi:hypothetical protein
MLYTLSILSLAHAGRSLYAARAYMRLGFGFGREGGEGGMGRGACRPGLEWTE